MTHEELVAQVAALGIEVWRLKDIVQSLSESHDQNRRELNAATNRAVDLTISLDQKVAVVDELLKRREQ